MRYRTFPGTEITVSEVGFGTWTLATGWWGEKTDAEAVAMLRRARDEFGVTFFDAADTYGNGPAARRGQSELPQRVDEAYLRMAVDRCLERLETDYVDVLQLHNVKMEHVRDAEVWDTLRALKREGKIRAWGAAFGPAIGWLYEAVELCEREPDANTIQMIWNELEQHPGTAMIEAAREHAPNCCFNIRV